MNCKQDEKKTLFKIWTTVATTITTAQHLIVFVKLKIIP